MATISVRNLSVKYFDRYALKDINLDIGEETILVLGENGSGKTTLANAITGFLPDYAHIEGSIKIGDIEINEENYNRYRERKKEFKEISKILSYVPQEPLEILDPTYTAIQQIYEPVYYSNREYLIQRILERAKLTSAQIEEIARLAVTNRDRLLSKLANNIALRDQIESVYRYEGFESDVDEIITNKLSIKPSKHIVRFLSNYKLYSKIPILNWIINKEIKKEAMEYGKEVATIFNIREEYLSRYPSQLSGGLRQLILLAASLAGWPKVMVLDEPTSNLDSVAQFNLINSIIRIRKIIKMGILIVSHDVPLINVADKIVILKDGKIVASGTKDELEKSSDPYVSKLLSL